MRLIDADAIISQCKEYSNLLKYDGTTDREWAVVKRIILIIKEQPTIEPHCETCEAFNKTRLLIPQPQRKKGKWIEQDDSWDGVYYECSACGEPWTTIDGTPWDNGMKFCPNCGARMEDER